MTGWLWGVVTVVGPILFGVVLIYVLVRNRLQKNKPPEEVSERGARELREQLNEEDSRRDANKPV